MRQKKPDCADFFFVLPCVKYLYTAQPGSRTRISRTGISRAIHYTNRAKVLNYIIEQTSKMQPCIAIKLLINQKPQLYAIKPLRYEPGPPFR